MNDTATLQRMSEIAQNNFLKSGMDFRNMTITSAGLVRKS